MSGPIVIAGAGLAAANAAVELRERGFDGRLVLVGAEADPPYERPPLTKGLLRGESTLEDELVQPVAFYDEHGIELRLGARASGIDRDARVLEIAGGERLEYGTLLLATGAEPIRPRVPGADLAGVLTLRTVGDARSLSARARDHGPVVVVGGGWIGMEAAASLRQLGVEVTIVEAGASPLERVVGTRLGAVFADLHRAHGAEVLTGTALARLIGDGRVKGAVLDDGTVLECGTVLLGVGVRPAVELAERAGLAVDDGVVVDGALRTSDPHVFAAGDVARVDHPRHGPLRVEHWDSAIRQGQAAARSMLGEEVVFDATPYFFSDQYDLGLEYRGLADPATDALELRGDLEARSFVALWRRDGQVVAGMNVNDWDAAEEIEALLAGTQEPWPPSERPTAAT